jgi:acylphosphatase
VELVVQGESGEVRRFLDALRAEFERNLRGVEELVEPFDPEIRKGVTIRS